MTLEAVSKELTLEERTRKQELRKETLRKLRQLIDELRAHRSDRDAQYKAAVGTLATELQLLARKLLHSFEKDVGSAAFEEAVLATLHGTQKKKSEDWRRGFLAIAEEDPQPPANPLSLFRTMLRRRLLDAKDEAQRVLAPTEGDAENEGESSGRDALREGVVAPSTTEADVQEVPRGVVRTLRDAVRFGLIYLELTSLPELPMPDRSARRKDMAIWDELATFVATDVARGLERRSWREPGETRDLWGRAWQANYYDHEEATEYLHSGEIPPASTEKTANDRYAAHLRRMRLAYTAARRSAEAVVTRPPLLARARGRVPLEWDATDHVTLQVPRGDVR